MITVAQIGNGYWGKKYSRVLKSMKDVNLKWICKTNIDDCIFENTKFTNNINDILEDKEVDCVIIATPANTHFEIAKKCILAGKHCLVEKPFTLTSKEAEELIKLNKEKNLILIPGHIYLHHSGIQKLKEIIDFDVLQTYSKRLSLSKYPNSLNEVAIHDIYILEYLLGKNIEVKKLIGDLTHCMFNLKFNDTQSYIESCSNYSIVKVREIMIFGKDKQLIFDETPNYKIVEINLNTKEVKYIEFDESITPLEKQCKHFFDCVEGKDKPIVTAEDALRSIQIIEKLYKKL